MGSIRLTSCKFYNLYCWVGALQYLLRGSLSKFVCLVVSLYTPMLSYSCFTLAQSLGPRCTQIGLACSTSKITQVTHFNSSTVFQGHNFSTSFGIICSLVLFMLCRILTLPWVFHIPTLKAVFISTTFKHILTQVLLTFTVPCLFKCHVSDITQCVSAEP